VCGPHPIDAREESLELGAVVPQLDDLFNLGPAPVRHSHLPRHLGGYGAYTKAGQHRYPASQRARPDQPPKHQSPSHAHPPPLPPTNNKSTCLVHLKNASPSQQPIFRLACVHARPCLHSIHRIQSGTGSCSCSAPSPSSLRTPQCRSTVHTSPADRMPADHDVIMAPRDHVAVGSSHNMDT
jgi:hypothetical protein